MAAGRRAGAQKPYPVTKDMLPAEMDAAGVSRVVIVPATVEGDRNDRALEAARLHPKRFAVMGRLALERLLAVIWHRSGTTAPACPVPDHRPDVSGFR